MDLVLQIDHAMQEKMAAYSLFRIVETEGDQPIVGSLYIQRRVLSDPPPETISVTVHLDA